ncbi:MAG: carbohydrate ABC transporter permease, partial [Lachnospiraceae bacterium]
MSKKRKVINIISAILKYAVLIIGALFTLLPFLWMIFSSLKTPAEIISIPPTLLPSEPQWSNYAEAWKAAPFPRYFLNTLIVTFFSTLGVLVTA